MDYRIRRTKSELESTGYIEICPGRHSGAHWREGSVFITEDAFAVAEGILAHHLPGYDHWAMNDIPKNIGLKVIGEWRVVGQTFQSMSLAQAKEALRIADGIGEPMDDDTLSADKSNIAAMLRELADQCEHLLSREGWICILGI